MISKYPLWLRKPLNKDLNVGDFRNRLMEDGSVREHGGCKWFHWPTCGCLTIKQSPSWWDVESPPPPSPAAAAPPPPPTTTTTTANSKQQTANSTQTTKDKQQTTNNKTTNNKTTKQHNKTTKNNKKQQKQQNSKTTKQQNNTTIKQRSDGLFTRGRLGLSSLLSQKFSTLHSLSSTRCATDTPILCRPVNIPPTPAWRSINNVSKLHGTSTSPPPQRGVASTTWASYMER